jgi:CubicO group peptidase (beta-lactamase class C family)
VQLLLEGANLKRTFSAKALPVLLAAATAGACFPGDSNDAVRSQLASSFAPLSDGRSPGLAVLVRKEGQTVFEAGYGMRELGTLSRIDAKTNFRLASFTKQFTAMAAMLLIHDGKLRYGQTLNEIFPNFPPYGRRITIRHLLTHTSGLPDYEDLMEEKEKARGLIWTPTHQIRDDEVLHLLEEKAAPKFAAGTGWAYSNSGYVVLGMIVAKVSGEPFDKFLHDRIFAPLGMKETLAFVNGKNIVPNRAFGHTRQETGFVVADQSPTSATLGDGGIYSNLTDLAGWDAALENHVLLSEPEMQAAWTPARLDNGSLPLSRGDEMVEAGKPVSYGFGWFLDPYQGHARMWHTGSTFGFGTVIERFTQEKLTIIILCNRTDLDPGKLALQAADSLLRR